ncbi:hypothetical protein NZK35_00555 [Stieleria sp. ICT_E10.1]|uniref:hypothetical protein n=1 Tax=Stieleria sedimenti TaxID=2976331 RepID=UPI0021800AAE|nr:hypothetical protein [Stieleria sedimenti]MCS7465159.1 hypothetical protein [Stieleria sedimenti]
MIMVKCNVNVNLKKPVKKKAEPADEPPVKRRGKVPRISRLMALAIRMDEMLRRGEAQDTIELAKMGKVSQPRLTQILSLSLLAPEIQEALLYLPREMTGRSKIHERNLRPITKQLYWVKQREMWSDLIRSVGPAAKDV